MATVDINLIGIPTFEDLPSNLVLFPTNAPSDIATYYKMVQSISDPDYPEPAVNFATPAITTTAQLLAKLATSAGVLAGNPGIINITTLGNIRRVSGTGLADFYFKVYHRDGAGVETLISTSNNTTPIDTVTFEQFSAIGLLNNGDFSPTDRIVIYYYANRIPGGSNPVYEFQFGGASPVRTFLPVPASNILNVPLVDEVTEYLGGANGHVVTIQSGKVKSAPFPVMGITIGTTAITSGTVGRVLFEGAGNVVQESANLFWDNTNGRLGIGTSSPSAPLQITTSGLVTALYINTGNDGGFTAQNNGTLAVNRTTQVRLVNGSTIFGANDRTYQLVNIGKGTTDADFYVQYWNGASYLERFRVFSTGNVSIGTTTDAGFKLDVNGTARVQGQLSIGVTGTAGRVNLARSSNGTMIGAIYTSGNNLVIENGSQALIFNTIGAERMRFAETSANLLIGTTTDVPSALVTISSTTQGFLPPRMTTTQKNAIASPAAGLMVYDTTLNVISYYNGTMWI